MKKVMFGLIVGVILSTCFVGYSTSKATGEYVIFNFQVNGSSVAPSNTPISVAGRSYLPVRDVAYLLGYDVDYDAETNTIILNNDIVVGDGSVLNIYVNGILATNPTKGYIEEQDGIPLIRYGYIDELLQVGVTWSPSAESYTFTKGEVSSVVNFVLINNGSYFALPDVVNSLGGKYTKQPDGIYIEL